MSCIDGDNKIKNASKDAASRHLQHIYEKFNELDAEEMCDFCRYSMHCGKGVVGSPNGPVYPPCSDKSPDDWFDFECFAESLKNEGDVD